MYQATLVDSAVAATKRYLLVPRDSGTTYPHKIKNNLILKRLAWTVQLITAGSWRLKVGIVTRNSGTNGDVHWFHWLELLAPGALVGDQEYQSIDNLDGLSMGFNTSTPAIPIGFVTSKKDINSVNWKNDVANLTDASGVANASPSPGDIVMELEEVVDGGTITLDISAGYMGR